MLKRTKYFIGGLFIALTVGAIAQTSGLPSRPRFLSVGVGTAAPSTNGNMTVSGTITSGRITSATGLEVLNSNGSRGSHPVIFAGTQPGLTIRDDDGKVDEHIWGLAVNSLGCLQLIAGNDSATAAQFPFTICRTGTTIDSFALRGTSITANGIEICRQDGTGCPASGPKHAYAKFTANAGGCSINSAWQNIGFASCNRSSTGIYTASFTPSYFSGPGNPICVANQDAPTVGFAAVNTSNLSGVTVSTVNTSFAVADNGTFTVICHGN